MLVDLLATRTVLLDTTAKLDQVNLLPALRDSIALDVRKDTSNVRMELSALRRVLLKFPAQPVCTVLVE